LTLSIFPYFVSIVVIITLLILGISKLNRNKKYIEKGKDPVCIDKITIQLDDFKIKSNKWSERLNVGTERIPDFIQKEFFKTYISITVNYQGKKIILNEHLDLDPIVVKLKFSIQKETMLYFYENNEKYLDLDFLYS
jgi:hypothetical protein